MKIPNTQKELNEIKKANNVTTKINSKGKLNGVFGAYRKVAEFIGYKDNWEVYYIAAKQHHSLLDGGVIASIKYDKLMGKLQSTYSDYSKRELRIFKTEKQCLNYLKNNT